jgi:hypothetical protein
MRMVVARHLWSDSESASSRDFPRNRDVDLGRLNVHHWRGDVIEENLHAGQLRRQ